MTGTFFCKERALDGLFLSYLPIWYSCWASLPFKLVGESHLPFPKEDLLLKNKTAISRGQDFIALTGTGLGWMRRPTFKCSQYTAPTFPIQLQYGTFGTGVATAQKFAQVWLQAGYDQKKCGNCCTSFPKIHCGSRWFWVLLENKKLQGSVVMSVSTTTQEYNCFDKHLNTSLLRKLWQPWLLGKPHWNSCCAPNHPGKGLDPPSNQANAHLILANSSLKKCPKPSGQGLRPPPSYGQCPNAPCMNLRGGFPYNMT